MKPARRCIRVVSDVDPNMIRKWIACHRGILVTVGNPIAKAKGAGGLGVEKMKMMETDIFFDETYLIKDPVYDTKDKYITFYEDDDTIPTGYCFKINKIDAVASVTDDKSSEVSIKRIFSMLCIFLINDEEEENK